MKIYRLLLFAALILSVNSFAQNYRITHLFITQNSSPTGINGLITIEDSTLTTSYYSKDTTVEKHKITKIEGTTYYLDNNSIYIFSPSSDKKERKSGVYYVEMTTTQKIKDPKRKSLQIRVVTE